MLSFPEPSSPWTFVLLGEGPEVLPDGSSLVAVLGSVYPKDRALGLSLKETLQRLRSYELVLDCDLPTRGFMSFLDMIGQSLNVRPKLLVGVYCLSSSCVDSQDPDNGITYLESLERTAEEYYVRPAYDPAIVATLGFDASSTGAYIERARDFSEWLSLVASESAVHPVMDAVQKFIPRVALGSSQNLLSRILIGGLSYEDLFEEGSWKGL